MVNEPVLRTHVPGIEWPAMPDAPTAMLLALSWQLDESEWWTPDELARHQARQRAIVLAHAVDTVPLYEHLDRDDWSRVPVMTRDRLIDAGAHVLSHGYPAAHGEAKEVVTSRNTGQPIRVRTSAVLQTLWQAITLRDHRWHRRDLGAHLAMIRHTFGDAPPPDGAHRKGWGAPTSIFAPDAKLSMISIAATTDEHVAWLRRVQPDHLLVYPSALDAILRVLAATGERLPSITHVRTISEQLAPETRALCREVLGVPIVDAYSADEVGYIALQCPEHEHYHVMAERLFVEILDEHDRPCAPGETGRVVITDLHNFATPLLRYDLGDYAEVGAPCPCGRGLPVLARILGRRRNMLTYPDGRTRWPVFTIACRRATRYRVIQLVQPDVDTLRVRLVPDGEVAPDARERLTRALHEVFEHPFVVELEVVDDLRGPRGKLEEFVSLIR